MSVNKITAPALLMIALVAGGLVLVAGCGDEGSIAPFEPTPLPNAFLHSFSVFPTTLGLAGREAEMTAYVVDGNGIPAENVWVRFASDLGEVVDSVQTDSLGVAKGIFTSGTQKGTATVVASIGSIQFTASILIGANELTIDETSAIADGRTVINVSASVFRPDGAAAQHAFVTFSSTAGVIPSTALTDSSGFVSVQLTAPASDVDIQAEVTATVEGSEIDPTGEFGVPPDEEQVVGVGIIQFRGITLSMSTESGEMVASGKDSSEVYCLVAETVTRVPVPHLDVYFGTDLGVISSPNKTDDAGVATAKIFSGIFPGTATIVGFVEALTDSTTMEFTPLTLLPLKGTPRNILISGDQSIISTRLLNQSNNPVPGMVIEFETDLGVIPGEGVTDSLGEVAVPLTSGDSVGTATVTARFGSLYVSTEVAFESPVVEPLRLDSLWWSPIPVADGASGTWVMTRLRNSTNNPIEGKIVEWSTDMGTITEVDTTDSLGVAEGWLFGIESDDSVAVNVTASHGSLTVSSPVIFVPAAAQTPVAMTLTPAVSSIQVSGAGGLESVVLNAVAFDASGDTVVGGSDVTFRIVDSPGAGEYLVWPDSGSGSEVTVPITNGVAQITLNAGTKNGVVALEAETGNNVVATTQVTVVSGPPVAATVAIDSIVSVASGGGMYAWKVAVLVVDAYSNPVANGTPVFLTLHADSCSSGDAPDGLSISGDVSTYNVPSCQALLPEPGLAYACIVGPYFQFFDFPSFAIEARSGDNDLLGCLAIDHGLTDNAPASVVVVSVEDSSLSVAGVGGDETSLITWEVRDSRGFPLGLSNPVEVDFSLLSSPGGGITLEPSSAITNGDGRVTTTLRSGANTGVVKVMATAATIQSSVSSIAIHGGPPHVDHFSIAANKINVPGLLLMGIEDALTAFVFDEHGNPVPAGTAVSFTTDFGGVGGSATTDDEGQANSILYSALPLPSCAEGGLVTVSGTTIDGNNQEITAQTQVLFSGATTITSDVTNFAVPDGGFVDIIVYVQDACGNPLSEDTRVEIATSSGELVGATDTALPDTRSTAYTQFWVRLTDSDAGDTQGPEGVSIEVTVTSQNGNGTYIIFGTLD